MISAKRAVNRTVGIVAQGWMGKGGSGLPCLKSSLTDIWLCELG